jgi:hypothetical protein
MADTDTRERRQGLGQRRARLAGDFRDDLRYAVRLLGRQKGFAAAALLTLGLGIGANTAVFSVVRHVLLAPLPYANPDRVGVIWSRWKGFDKTWVYGLWQGRYAADPAIVGRTILVDGTATEVVGVMPRGFQLPTLESGRPSATAH